MKIGIEGFRGMRPRMGEAFLEANEASYAQDCKLYSGELRPLGQPVQRATLTKGGSIQTIYLWQGQNWFHWAADVDVVASPVPGDVWGHVFWTGDGIPKASVGGNPDGPAFSLGVPAPTSAPVVPSNVVNPTGGGSGDPQAGAHGTHGIPTWPGGVSEEKQAAYEYYLTHPDATWMSTTIINNVLEFPDDFIIFTSWQEELDRFGLTREDVVVIATALGPQDPVPYVPLDERSPGSATAERETRFYVYTFVNAWGWESAPSPPSGMSTVEIGASVAVTSLEAPPSGPYDWIGKRIYRLATGLSGSEFLYLDMVGVGATSYTDSQPTSALAEPLETEGWAPPPDDMKGLTVLPNGALAGFSGHDIYFSPPYVPYAYPRAWSVATEWEIVGLATFENNLVVLTKGHPYLATGSDPSAMMLSKLEINQACVSKKSIASVGSIGVLYASPDGLVSIGGTIELVSDRFMTRDEWQEYNPSSIVGTTHDNEYIGFFTDHNGQRGGFVFSSTNGFTKLSLTATAAYSDLLTDKLYFTDGSSKQVMEYDAGAPMTYTWRSKQFKTPPLSFSSYRVRGHSPFPALNVKVGAEDVLLINEGVPSAEGRRLPVAQGKKRRWQVELSGTAAVEGVVLATSMVELVD